jgi:hypothetical protein
MNSPDEVIYRFLKYAIGELEESLQDLKDLSTTEEEIKDYNTKLNLLNKLKEQLKEYGN